MQVNAVNPAHLGALLPIQKTTTQSFVKTGQGVFESVINAAKEPSKDVGLISAGILKTLFAAGSAVSGAAITTWIKDNTALDVFGRALMFVGTPLMVFWAVKDFWKLKSTREVPESAPGKPFNIANAANGNVVSEALLTTASQINLDSLIKLDKPVNPTILNQQIKNFDALFNLAEFKGAVKLGDGVPGPDLLFSGVEGHPVSLRRIKENYSLLLAEAQLREVRTDTAAGSPTLANYLPDNLDPLRFTTQFRVLHTVARNFGTDGSGLPQIQAPSEDLKNAIAGYKGLQPVAKAPVDELIDNYSRTSNVLNILNAAISKVLYTTPKNSDEEREIALIRAALITGFKITKSNPPGHDQVSHVHSILAQRQKDIEKKLKELTDLDSKNGIRGAFERATESFKVEGRELNGITSDIISITSQFRI